MKRFSMLFSLALCLVSVTTDAGRAPGKGFDDPQILARVKDALAGQGSGDIHVEICNGVVQLTGLVGSEPGRVAAGRMALDVSGVRDLRNHLLIEPELLVAGESLEDRQVVSRIKTNLGAKEGIDSFDIHVEVRSGVALLGGFVRSNGERKAAVRAARTTRGVREVINRIDVIRAT